MAPGTVQGLQLVVADIESARPREVAAQVMELAVRDRERADGDLIEQLGTGLGNGEGAVAGTQLVLEALNRHAVGVLLACPDLSGTAVVCPSCGWLGLEATVCPIDSGPSIGPPRRYLSRSSTFGGRLCVVRRPPSP